MLISEQVFVMLSLSDPDLFADECIVVIFSMLMLCVYAFLWYLYVISWSFLCLIIFNIFVDCDLFVCHFFDVNVFCFTFSLHCSYFSMSYFLMLFK